MSIVNKQYNKPPRYTLSENLLLHTFGISPEKNKEIRQLGLSDAVELKGGKHTASRRKLKASRHKRRVSRRKRNARK
jgi:hypothetical protein